MKCSDIFLVSFPRLTGTGLAEFGTEQLEYIKLSDWTGNATYARIVEGNVALLHEKYPDRVSLHVTETPHCQWVIAVH